jgi:hypothetical protein
MLPGGPIPPDPKPDPEASRCSGLSNDSRCACSDGYCVVKSELESPRKSPPPFRLLPFPSNILSSQENSPCVLNVDGENANEDVGRPGVAADGRLEPDGVG